MCPKRAVALHASAKAHTYFHFHLANQMDSEIIKSIDMTDITVDASVPDFLSRVEKHIESENSSMANSGSGTSNRVVPAPAGFTWAVDSAIRSSTAPNSLASQVRSFTSVVDKAMRSSSGADLGASSLHSFASEVESAMRSIEQDTGTSHSPASGVDNVMSNATGDVKDFQLFTLAKLVAATNNFSLDNKIGAGSFGVSYRAKLVDGREVAIKRGDTWSRRKGPFKFELAFLSRLHHNHLVGIVGFCEEKDEKLLVYEYMENLALYDHLHGKNNVKKGGSVLNSWKMRIKIALDASQGIAYLHNNAVPSIIHGDFKSSNILLDATWTARVSDFGLKAAGTVGYIDPEYYDLNVLTAKSDVYALGVVLLELLTGKRAIFEYVEDGDTLLSVVDFAVAAILAGDLLKILDPRLGPPDVNEAEAVELVASTATHCVNLKGEDRPIIADIVVILKQALAICNSNHDSITSGTIPVLLTIKKRKISNT